MIWKQADRKATAYYHAGYAVALAALGKDSIALSLADTPRMRTGKARRILAGDGSFKLPPGMCEQSTHDFEGGVLPLLTGGTALVYACGGDAAPKLKAAISVFCAGMLGNYALANSRSEAERVIAQIDVRARELATWRRHTIARIAAALLDRGKLTANEVASLVST
jgi:hypothetical protein